MAGIKAYTDGGCSGNPGPGAWAYILLVDGDTKSVSGYDRDTTNNKMELSAAINALGDIAGHSRWKTMAVDFYTDSQYVKNGITQWIIRWERNGWKTQSKQPVKNQELWKKLKYLSDSLEITWNWVKGHGENSMNNKCDAMVQREIRNNS